jgi:hypothetical protein
MGCLGGWCGIRCDPRMPPPSQPGAVTASLARCLVDQQPSTAAVVANPGVGRRALRIIRNGSLPLMLLAGTVHAQEAHAARAAVTQVGALGTTVGEILRMERVGTPLLLADGGVEHHFRVIANVPFTLVVAAMEAAPASEGDAHAPLLANGFTGTRGYHADIRIISRGKALIRIVAAGRTRGLADER